MTLAVRLDKELQKRYKTLAEVTERPMSFYAKKALAEAIDSFEELYYSIYELERKGLANNFEPSQKLLNAIAELENGKTTTYESLDDFVKAFSKNEKN